MPYYPTLRSVNLLFLISMVLVVIAGSVVQALSPSWGLVITEVFLILLPGLLFLRILRLPLRETTRLRWPGLRFAGLSILIGIGLALFAYWLGSLITELFGYTFPLPPEFYPTTPLQVVVIFSALAFFAPVCEEFLFRGIIQRGYERLGPWTAIVVVGLYFALYHLSFQRLLAIAPVALVLGYVAWRSNALLSSILVHASYNALSGVLLLVSSLRPDIDLDIFGSLPLAVVGLVLGGAGLWLYSRSPERHPAIAFESQLPPSYGEPAAVGAGADAISPGGVRPAMIRVDTSSWLGRTWPLAIAFLIFLVLAGLEFLIGRYPDVFAIGPLQFRSSPWNNPAIWRYELRNVLDEQVGTAECSLEPQAEVYVLACQVDQQAFEASQERSTYQSGAFELQQTALWDRYSLQLLEATGSQQGEDLDLSWSVSTAGEGLALSVQQAARHYSDLPLPEESVLLEHEWPWRLQALPFSLSYSRRVTHVRPLQWSETAGENVPLAEEALLVVVYAEPVWTPAGNFIAWKVTVGDQAAWYDSDPPHTLLRYDNGIESYLLTGVED